MQHTESELAPDDPTTRPPAGARRDAAAGDPAERGAAALAAALARDPGADELWAEFDRDGAAIAAARELRERLDLPTERTRVLTEDTLTQVDYERVLGPGTERVRRVLAASHLVFGAVGGVLGLLAALVVQQGGVVSPAATGYPFLLPAIGIMFGVFGGLLYAGLRSLRPQRDFVLAWVRDAIHRRRHAFVIVRPRDRDERARARDVLGKRPLRIMP